MEELKLRLKPHVKPQDLIPFGYTIHGNNYVHAMKHIIPQCDDIFIAFKSNPSIDGIVEREIYWNSTATPRPRVEHYIQDLIQAGMVE